MLPVTSVLHKFFHRLTGFRAYYTILLGGEKRLALDINYTGLFEMPGVHVLREMIGRESSSILIFKISLPIQVQTVIARWEY